MEEIISVLKTIWAYVFKFWEFKLFTVDKNDIDIGQIIIGIALLFVFYKLSRKISQFLAQKLFSKMQWDTSTRLVIEKVVFYFLLALSVLFVLSFLNIPITIFTVLSGALAIGVGFGSQNIVNNFMSGMILMMEQPIRIGDLVEVDGLYGLIEDIGPRSTRVKAANNTHIVVPNSSFLEKNVLNWTLSDSVVRSTVRVGVAYGSPVKRVEELMYKVAENTNLVLKHPPPVVIFEDFGDNSLVFDLYFYAQIKNVLELKKISSQIRFQIDEEFNREGIVIAFPQRDVHLDQLKPFKVEVLSNN